MVEPILKKLQVDLGWQKAMIPKDYGGNEAMSLVSGELKQEQVSRGDYGMSLASACVDWGLAPATMACLFGSSGQSRHGGNRVDAFAPKFVENKLRIGLFQHERSEIRLRYQESPNEARLIRPGPAERQRMGNQRHQALGHQQRDRRSSLPGLQYGSKTGVQRFTLIYIPNSWDGVSHGRYEVKCGVGGDTNTSTYFDKFESPRSGGCRAGSGSPL